MRLVPLIAAAMVTGGRLAPGAELPTAPPRTAPELEKLGQESLREHLLA